MNSEIFERVNLPSHMLVSELVTWIALGRAPKVELIQSLADTSNYGWIDWRRTLEAGYEGAPAHIVPTFSESEFSLLGSNIDYEKYLNLSSRIGIATGAEIIDEDQSISAEFDAMLRADLPDLSEREQTALIEGFRQNGVEAAALADELRAMEEGFQPLLDRAFAMAFDALSSGRLVAEAWAINSSDDDKIAPKLGTVPQRAWTFKGFDLPYSELNHAGTEYRVSQVSVQEALKLFHRPEADGSGAAGIRYGDTLIVEAEHQSRPAPRRPGRPPKGTASIKKFVQFVFKDKLKRGELPSKKEAQIQDVVEFVQIQFGVEIGRSTAQSYLQEIYQDDPK